MLSRNEELVRFGFFRIFGKLRRRVDCSQFFKSSQLSNGGGLSLRTFMTLYDLYVDKMTIARTSAAVISSSTCQFASKSSEKLGADVG